MRTTNPNLYLVGFMGTGKSTVGRMLSKQLRLQFFDSDQEIERQQGRPVSRIFVEDGEARFREMEREFIVSGHPAHGCVVATGGGLVVPAGMLELLRSRGVVICLHASIETILERTRHTTHRPLLLVDDPEVRLRDLYGRRASVYRSSGTMIMTDRRPIRDIAAHVLRIYRQEAVQFKP